MSEELLSLPAEQQIEYFAGLDSRDRHDVLERLRRWPRAEAVHVLLEEAQRCVTKAAAPNGGACVAGKALDLLLDLLGFELKGTLGSKLKSLRQIAAKESSRIHLNKSEQLVAELLTIWDHLQTRNSAAHHRAHKPEVTSDEASAFIHKVGELYELEKKRQSELAAVLHERSFRRSPSRIF